MAKRSPDFITETTAQVRYGFGAWTRAIRPCVTRYLLPDGSELFDDQEIRAFILKWARAEQRAVAA